MATINNNMNEQTKAQLPDSTGQASVQVSHSVIQSVISSLFSINVHAKGKINMAN